MLEVYKFIKQVISDASFAKKSWLMSRDAITLMVVLIFTTKSAEVNSAIYKHPLPVKKG